MLDGVPLDQIDEGLLRTMPDTKFNGIKKESLGMRASCHAHPFVHFFLESSRAFARQAHEARKIA